MKALILAGGEGSRLRPLTFSVPKPLLPIGEKPILEVIINRLKKFGFKEFVLSIGYRGELIESYFQNGQKLGVKIDYVKEAISLGTAGPLALLINKVELNLNDPILLMNGDILTRLNFSKFVECHKNHGFDLTVMVKKFEMKFPYGILNVENKDVKEVTEKPIYYYDISTGIYLLNSNILGLVPKERFFTMPQFINLLIEKKKRVYAYFSEEQWMAVEEFADIEKINNDLKAWLDEDEL